MASYKHFADYYDILTSNIPYVQRGEYFNAILKRFGKKDGILLDLACGTGSLSEVMDSLGYDVIGVDNSEEMLNIAMNKRFDSGKDIIYLCQDMQSIDMYGTIDVCVCALDSINHVTDEKTVKKIFERVSLFLHPDGIFIFDVNSPYKHNNVLSDATFTFDYDDVYCVWQNSKCHNNIVDIELQIFGRNEDNTYNRYIESFSERAYTHEEILSFISSTDLELLKVYADDSFNEPNEKSERLIYVVASTKKKQGRDM